VMMSVSWIGPTPSDVTFNLPSPITPPSDSMTTSPLTVTASNTASTGSYTLRVTGTSGVLTHQVDITVQITAAATTNGTTIVTPTVTVTTEQPPSYPPSFWEQIPGGATTLLIALIAMIAIIAVAASRRGHKTKNISR
jgi:hypothetical protein